MTAYGDEWTDPSMLMPDFYKYEPVTINNHMSTVVVAEEFVLISDIPGACAGAWPVRKGDRVIVLREVSG